MTTSKSNPLAIAILTRSQRTALYAAAARRAQYLRKQAKRATHLAGERAWRALCADILASGPLTTAARPPGRVHPPTWPAFHG